MPEMDSGKEVPVRVAVRVRPFLAKEKLHRHESCVRLVPAEKQVAVGKDKNFTFDYTFGPEVTQEELFSSAVETMLDRALEGYNGTVFAYGQTGSGKTHTILGGDLDFTGPNAGLVPRAVQRLFSRSSHLLVRCSFVEIYREELRDLLDPSAGGRLQLREDERGQTQLVGAREPRCECLDDVLSYLLSGMATRRTAATGMNEASSRSHSVFTLVLEHRRGSREDDVTWSKLHFVDLAGSERADKTGNIGMRFRESVSINSGLLALGNVISALADRKGHVPYRDSKITRLLKDALGGSSMTLMVCCVSPDAFSQEESLSSLKYAQRARNIRNRPVRNRDRLVTADTDILDVLAPEPDARVRSAVAEARLLLVTARERLDEDMQCRIDSWLEGMWPDTADEKENLQRCLHVQKQGEMKLVQCQAELARTADRLRDLEAELARRVQSAPAPNDLRVTTRKTRSSPPQLGTHRMVQTFRAKSHLLLSRLEEEDTVLQEPADAASLPVPQPAEPLLQLRLRELETSIRLKEQFIKHLVAAGRHRDAAAKQWRKRVKTLEQKLEEAHALKDKAEGAARVHELKKKRDEAVRMSRIVDSVQNKRVAAEAGVAALREEVERVKVSLGHAGDKALLRASVALGEDMSALLHRRGTTTDGDALRTLAERRRAELERKLNAGELLDADEERSLLELDEAVEAFKAEHADTHSPAELQARLHSMPPGELRHLAMTYFSKVVSLRLSDKRRRLRCDELQLHVGDLTRQVEELETLLSQAQLDADRKMTLQQQDYEQQLSEVLAQLCEADKERDALRKLCRELKRKMKERDTPAMVRVSRKELRPLSQEELEHRRSAAMFRTSSPIHDGDDEP